MFKYIFLPLLVARYFFHRITRTGCFGPGAEHRFTPGPEHRDGNTLKAGLFRHHIKQFHGSSCSVASVVTVINALLERYQGPHRAVVTQKQILNRVRAAHWKERMSDRGYHGRRGMPLDALEQVVRESLEVYNIPYDRVEVIRVSRGADKPRDRQRIFSLLKRFEQQDDCLIIGHFDQGSFVRELNIPHISPVGGFDPETGRVTILDVDPYQPLPYTIPFFRFYRGISTGYWHLFRINGFTGGGLVVIYLKPR